MTTVGKMENLLEVGAHAGRNDGAAANRLLVDPLTGFGTRYALLLALAETVEPESMPRLLVVFGLDGFDEYTSLFGRLAGRTLLVRLAARLSEALAPAGVCFRPRHDEFSALIETTIDAAKPVLDTAVFALRERASSGAVTAAWGAVLLPEEADAPVAALKLADARLASNAPRRRRRNRRSSGAGRL
jgi:GGDEF domain-containing protein